MVTSSTETLLTTDRELLGVEESTEELPASGHLVAVETLSLSNKVDGTAGGHRSSEAIDTVLLEVRDEVGVVSDDGQGVTRGDESVGAVDHVSVTIAVRSGTEGDVVLVNNLDQRVSVGKVRIGVATVEVGARHTVLCGVAEAKLLLEDSLSVRASDTVETVEEDLEVGVGREELLDEVEVEDVLEHGNVIGSAVDNLNLEVAVGVGTNIGDVNVRNVGDLV